MELTFLETSSRAIQTALMLAAPILGISLALGFLISIFQAVTSIQEQTLTFVPKIFAAGVALTFFGPKMSLIMTSFATELFSNLDLYVK